MKRAWRQLLAGLVVMTFAISSVDAREMVGTALVDGKKVTLFSDRTWEFEDPEPSLEYCASIHKSIKFCHDPLVWKRTRPYSIEITANFQRDDRHFGAYVIEELGKRDGYNYGFMFQNTLENAANASGADINQIPVLGVFDAVIDGRESQTLVYGVSLNGVSFVYANSITILEDLTVQSLTWAIGKEFSETHETYHEAFLANTKIRHKVSVE